MSIDRRITFDNHDEKGKPKIGDYMVSIGARGIGSAYLVLGVRPSARRPRRSYLMVQREEATPEVIELARWWFSWYGRKKRPVADGRPWGR